MTLPWIWKEIFRISQSLWRIILHISLSTYHWFAPRKKKDISNDIILITGGGKGIGRKLAIAFAEYRPKHIVLWGRTSKTLVDAAELISQNGVACSYMVCDVSNKEDVYRKACELQKTIGHVTVLVNNAAVVFGKSILQSDNEEVEYTFRTNMLGHFWTLKAFLPHMLETNCGHIVTMNSVLGMMGIKGAADYCSAKYGSLGLSEALWEELKDYTGIHVTSVHPYQVDNNMFAGCTVRFPLLFPPLSENYVAKETVKAVLTNKKQIIMPRLWYLTVWAKSWLPVNALLYILTFVGADKAMDTFRTIDATTTMDNFLRSQEAEGTAKSMDTDSTLQDPG